MTIRRPVSLALLMLLFFTCLHAQIKPSTKTAHHTRSASSMIRGKMVYKKICLACHMADGAGVPTMNPPLINTNYVIGDKSRLIKIVLNGFKEDVQINGQTFSNNMTPHSELKNQQIADVLTYVRKSFGNKASSVTATEVKKVRAMNKKQK